MEAREELNIDNWQIHIDAIIILLSIDTSYRELVSTRGRESVGEEARSPHRTIAPSPTFPSIPANNPGGGGVMLRFAAATSAARAAASLVALL